MKSDLADTGIRVGEGQIPIVKIPVIVNGNQGSVYLDELPQIPGGLVEESNGAPNEAMNVIDDREMRRLNLQMLSNNHEASRNQLQNWMLQIQSGFMILRH